MENNKLTKKECFQALIIELGSSRPELVDFCRHEIALLDKKSSKKAVSKKQQENTLIKESIQELDFSEALTLAEIGESLEGNYSVQKLSALMKQLVDEGLFARTKKGKKVAFERVV